jgi:conjugative transfer signal peptidase TraF
MHTAVPFFVMGLAALTVSILMVAWKAWGPKILINETPSEPLGFYRLVTHPVTDYRLTMYVVFPVPPGVRSLVYGRHWMKDGIPLLKEILGLAGDQVCVFLDRLEINGHVVGPVFQRDSVGLPLPQFPGCFEVQPGTFFAGSRYLGKSFDGRYFGPLPLSQLQGEARVLWTF